MSKAAQYLAGLTVVAALAESLVELRMRIDPWRLAALVASAALVVGAMVALTEGAFVRRLRHWAGNSRLVAAGLPFLLLPPYLIYGAGTGTWSALALGKLVAYIAVPVLLLLPPAARAHPRFGWRDAAALVALAVPVAAGWLANVWTWPLDLYFFGPVFCLVTGGYAFMVLRGLEGVGFRLVWRRADLTDGLANLAAFALVAIPLGVALGFLHPHHAAPNLSPVAPPLLFVGIYLTVAIPEEFVFRGVLQNLLAQTIRRGPPGFYALAIASVVFGASHLHHAPVPNWRYAIMATLAGAFYGNVYRSRRRLCACALTHALVDTVWHYWL